MRILTSDQIERRCEAMTDRLDRLFMTSDMTQAEYDLRQVEIAEWVDLQYRVLDRWAPRHDGQTGRAVS